MAVVENSVLIERTQRQMFELVDRVEDYPHFLPWCDAAEVPERTESRTLATIHVNYHGIATQFSTENSKDAPRLMEIRLTDGPFTRMDGLWRFTPLGETACKVEFRLHWEFAHPVLEKALGPVFKHITSSFIDCFVHRAHQIYD